MRLFVAVELPQAAIDSISRIQQKLKREIAADRWQSLSNLHLTLHFLGEVPEQEIVGICQDMDLVSSIIQPFTLQLGLFGVFPHPAKPRVLWLGISGGQHALEQLHLLLGKRFALREGIQFDKRPYRPHVTLARGPKAAAGGVPLHEWNRRLLDDPAPGWQVREVHLYRSELHPAGAVHTVLHTSQLQGGSQDQSPPQDESR